MNVVARERTRPKSSEDSKLLTPLVTAVITGITTIAVAFIGIVPQLRSQDKSVIGKYKADVESLQKKVGELTNPAGATWTFTGNVHPPTRKLAGNNQDNSVEVYLIPEVLGSHTDSAGEYNIRNVPQADYSLLARFPSGKTVTMHVDQQTKTFNTDDGFAITYDRADNQ